MWNNYKNSKSLRIRSQSTVYMEEELSGFRGTGLDLLKDPGARLFGFDSWFCHDSY